MLELEAVGPFSWIPSSTDAPPRFFDSPSSSACGIYLFTVSTAEGHLIYWVGQTSQAVRARLATHSREFLAGTYNVLDMTDLRVGKRTVLWRGLWWKKDSPQPLRGVPPQRWHGGATHARPVADHSRLRDPCSEGSPTPRSDGSRYRERAVRGSSSRSDSRSRLQSGPSSGT